MRRSDLRGRQRPPEGEPLAQPRERIGQILRVRAPVVGRAIDGVAYVTKAGIAEENNRPNRHFFHRAERRWNGIVVVETVDMSPDCATFRSNRLKVAGSLKCLRQTLIRGSNLVRSSAIMLRNLRTFGLV